MPDFDESSAGGLQRPTSWQHDVDESDIDEDQAEVERKLRLQKERGLAIPHVNSFELTLTRPLGFEVAEGDDGYVQITAINDDKASNLVKFGLRVGDRVVAVDSSLGDKLWPVSTVEGVISACTGRLPGQPVTLRFERPNVVEEEGKPVTPKSVAESVTQSQAAVISSPTEVVVPSPSTLDKKELIKRCRDVLRRYSEKGSDAKHRVSKLDGVPALVADKVVDALATASVAVDSVTLSMIMRAYLSCNQPEHAIRVFEASVGFRGDGSLTPVSTFITGSSNPNSKLRPSESALNLVAGTTLMQAHAMAGDMGSVLRVLAAMEGRSGSVIDGLEVAPWPWTGAYGMIQPDTVSYNVALAAAEKMRDLDAALSIFERMRDPKTVETSQDRRPEKDVVSYNTIISALSNAGRSGEAFAMLDEMKSIGARPDKYTYTALMKSCLHEGDVEELLYDMAEQGIAADVIMYNTMIRNLCEKRQWSQATKIITEMESNDISPDYMTYSFLMNAMLQAGKPSACLTLFESACANERTQAFTQHVHLYTIAITAACKLRDHDRALELVLRMTANGLKPNLKTLTAVMGACLACGKYDLATDVYRRIDEPDGYAMAQGLRALCGNGDLRVAASMLEGQRPGCRVMSGKDVMRSYETLLSSALTAKEYDLAREVFADLLKKNYIPNKAMLASIIDAFEIKTSSVVLPDNNDKLRFRFLLFVIDSLSKRNLPIGAALYAATLVLARQIGGVERKSGTLLVRAKTNSESTSKKLLSSLSSTTAKRTPARSIESWEQLLVDQSSGDHGRPKRLSLPDLSVRVLNRDIPPVFRAEQSVAYNARRRRRSSPPAASTET